MPGSGPPGVGFAAKLVRFRPSPPAKASSLGDIPRPGVGVGADSRSLRRVLGASVCLIG